MRKLRLEIDDLKVESFAATAGPSIDGTIHARVGDPDPITINEGESYEFCNTVGTCIGPSYCCPPTWKQTCPASCYQTAECGNSCFTWWCNTCASCPATCKEAESCTDYCNCPA